MATDAEHMQFIYNRKTMNLIKCGRKVQEDRNGRVSAFPARLNICYKTCNIISRAVMSAEPTLKGIKTFILLQEETQPHIYHSFQYLTHTVGQRDWTIGVGRMSVFTGFQNWYDCALKPSIWKCVIEPKIVESD